MSQQWSDFSGIHCILQLSQTLQQLSFFGNRGSAGVVDEVDNFEMIVLNSSSNRVSILSDDFAEHSLYKKPLD